METTTTAKEIDMINAIPNYSPFQPQRIIGYTYKGVRINGGTSCNFEAINSSGQRCQSDKMSVDQIIKLIDAHFAIGSSTNDCYLTVAQFIDHRMIKGN